MPYQVNNKALSWIPVDEIEDGARQQVESISTLPFIFKYVAVMPDCHFGLGATVGSCIPTKGAIIPAAVGVDIGCGMCAVKTPFRKDDFRHYLDDVHHAIETNIPLSAGSQNKSVRRTVQPRVEFLEEMAEESGRLEFYDSMNKNWRRQLGSLGSGNHFIELTEDESGSVWAFLHSGSRGIGNKLAQKHIKTARNLMDKYFISLPNPDLAYLVEGTPEFDEYMLDLEWAQQFAYLNRQEMMERVLNVVDHYLGEFQPVVEIDCHHNYTNRENHFGTNILVSRKGAISAREGQYGLIPGSMGTRSYVVKGKGDKTSFCTAPHGAGRRLSRRKARETFDMNDFDKAMQGITVRRSKEFLDELPGAYKDIDQVMEYSKDLVEIVHTFGQFINVKGN